MKRSIVILTIIALMGLVGCGEGKVVNGEYCDTYGLIDEDKAKCEGVKYRTIKGNVIWGIVLVQTIVAPIYFFGFSLYEPVGPIKQKK